MHVSQTGQPQSAGQLLQSSQNGSQNPFPQSGVHMNVVGLQELHVPHPQSAAQLKQFSQAGSHVPSPQAVPVTPVMQS